jgi:2-polyprenyl-3-methyl-5-hydroxy-6-metoxy-1,4-benzoquinol methylase
VSEHPPRRATGHVCRICGGPTAAAFVTRDFNRRLTEERFEYVRCALCGSFALRSVPEDMAPHYPPDYYSVPASREELLRVGGDAERHKLACVQRFVPGGRLVEIGPAVGAFLAVAQEAGYSVEAIEMDALCCRFLESELNVPTACSDDPAAVLGNAGRFDVIALWHVIEHVPDPPSIIAAAAEALAPGGVLALAAPNPQALQRRIFRARWTHIDAPRHLFLLPLATLAHLCTERGLEVVLATTSDQSAAGWNRFGWRESLAGLVKHETAARALRVLGSVIARAMSPIERQAGRGTTYTLLVRRPRLEVAVDRGASIQ